MKKIFAIISSIIMVASCTACSKGGGEGKGNVQSMTQTMYKETKISTLSDILNSVGLFTGEDGSLVFVYYDTSEKLHAVRYDKDCNEIGRFDIEKEENEFLSYFSPTSGGFRAFSSVREDDELVISVKTFSADGRVVSMTDLGDLDGHIDMDGYLITAVTFHDDNCLISLDDVALIVDGDGNVTDSISINSEAVFTYDSEGNIICCSSSNAARMDKLRVPKDKELRSNPNHSSMIQPQITGDDKFPAYLIFSDGIYGMSADGDETLILDFSASNIISDKVRAVTPLGEGKFVMLSESSLVLLTVRPDDYKENRETVILGVHDTINSDLRDLGTEFARFNDGYKVEMREYDVEKDELWTDILAGDSPDLYMPNTHEEIGRYVNLGATADFAELHEKYGGMSEDDFLPNVVSALKYKGKLYSMSNSFSPNVYIANRDVLSREQVVWNYEEFYGFVAALPDDMYISEHHVLESPQQMFDALCSMNTSDWIDYEKAECYFDTPEFVKLLEFCRDANYVGGYGTNYYSVTTNEDRKLDAQENLYMLGREKALFGLTNGLLSTPVEYISAAAGHSMNVSDITLVSMPNSTRRGTIKVQEEYMVLGSGKCQQGGWEFLNFLMSFDQQTSLANSNTVWHTRKDAFDYTWEKMFTEMNESDIEYSTGIDGYDYSYNIHISRDEYDYLKDSVLSCDKFAGYNRMLTPILSGEFSSFIGGDISAGDCAKRIQNRVSIALSEQE